MEGVELIRMEEGTGWAMEGLGEIFLSLSSPTLVWSARLNYCHLLCLQAPSVPWRMVERGKMMGSVGLWAEWDL